MRYRIVLATASLVLISALAPHAASKSAGPIYLATDGADTNPGTPEAPVATVRKAVQLAERRAGLAEIVVRGGVYFLERTVAIRPSKKTDRLVVRAADKETPIFDGSVPIEKAEPMKGAPGVYTVKGDFRTDEPPTIWDEGTGRHFIKLAALDSVQATDYSSVVLDERTMAIRCKDGVSPGKADIRMSRRGVMYGFEITRDNVTVRGIEFRNFVERRAASAIIIGKPGMVRGRGKDRKGDFVSNTVIDSCGARNCYFAYRVYTGGSKSRITRCRARNCVTGIWVSGLDTVVEHCEFVNDPDWHSEKLTWDRTFDRRGVSFYHGPGDAVIRHNLIKNFSTGVFSKGSPGEYIIENNTFINGLFALSPDPGFRVRRNIFAGYRAPFSGPRGEKATIDYNVFWGPNNFSRGLRDRKKGAGPHNVFADPRFASPAKGDYRLLPGSPAIRIGGRNHAGAYPPTPKDYQGPPNLRVGLAHRRGVQTRDPFPPPGLPQRSCYVSSRGAVEANLAVTSVAPVRKIRFGVGDRPMREREFKVSDQFKLPGEDGLHRLRFQVQDANGAWSAESVIHVTLRRGSPQLVGGPEIRANRYGALFSFKANRYARGKLEVRRGDKWVEAADSSELSAYRDSSALPLLATGLPPGTPHRYRLTVSTSLDSVVKEGEFVLSGRPKIMYVSPEGEDAQAGGTRGKPFRTIQFALDRALPGDRVRIMPGLYFGAHILAHGGTKEQPLVVEGMYPNTVALDGLREVGTLLSLRNASHVVLRNLNFRWYGSSAVAVGGSKGVRVSRCRFRNQYWRGGAGVACRTLRFFNSPDFTVDHCIITRTRYGVEVGNSPGGRIVHNTATANAVTHILWRGSPTDDIVIRYNSLNWNGNQMINIGLPAETVRKRSAIDYNNYGTTFRRPEGTETRHGKYGRSLKRPFPYLPTNREFMAGAKAFVNMEDWLEYSGQDKHSIFADPKWIDPRAGRFDVAADSPNLLPDGKVIGALGYLGKEPNMPPAVAVTSPCSGDKIAGKFALTADASDYDGHIKKVEFYADGKRIGECSTRPYRAPGVTLPPGRHVVTARAVDDKGAATVSDETRISLDEK